MKTRWALLSAAIFFGLLSNQLIAAEGVLGQGNISCDSWIKSRGDGNPVAATRTAWVLGFVTAFNQYRSKPEGDVSGGKDTEVLMLRIDDHCRLYPLDNLYKASAALVDERRYFEALASDVRAAVARGATLLHRAWGNANETRTKLRYTWHEFFKNFDVLLTPVAATAAPLLAAVRRNLRRCMILKPPDGFSTDGMTSS